MFADFLDILDTSCFINVCHETQEAVLDVDVCFVLFFLKKNNFPVGIALFFSLNLEKTSIFPCFITGVNDNNSNTNNNCKIYPRA